MPALSCLHEHAQEYCYIACVVAEGFLLRQTREVVWLKTLDPVE
jgi:hypothetical protein